MRWMTISSFLFAVALAGEAHAGCACSKMAAFSSADLGECKVSETKKPTCHLRWYNLGKASLNVARIYDTTRNQILTELSRQHISIRVNPRYFAGMEAAKSGLSTNKEVGRLVDQHREFPPTFHYAWGYLAFTKPARYQLEPLLQSLALHIATSNRAQLQAIPLRHLLRWLDGYAEQLRASIVRAAPPGPQRDPMPQYQDNDTVVSNYSGTGCIDLRFNHTEFFPTLRSFLLKTRQSRPSVRRC